MQKKKSNEIMRYLRQIADGAKRYIALLLLVQVLLSINGVLFALFLRNIINAAAAGQRALFWQNTVGFGVLASIQVGLGALVRWLDEFTLSRIENRCKQRLLEQLLWRDYAAVKGVHSGEWMNRLTGDASVVADGLTHILPSAVGMSVRMLAAAALIVVLEPRFALLLLAAILVLPGAAVLLRRRMKRQHRLVQEADGFLRCYLQEILGALPVIHAYAAEQAATAEAGARMNRHRAARMSRNRLSNLAGSGFTLLANGAYVVGAGFCGYGILTGRLDYGTFLAIFQLIGQIQSPFAGITGILPRCYSMAASAERLLEPEHYAMQRVERLEMDQVRETYARRFCGIAVEKLCFGYHDGTAQRGGEKQQVIRNLSLVIRKGDIAAFTGMSGCGKSTLLKLLLGLYTPDSGSCTLLLDGGKTEPLTTRWQRLFAYVPQGNCLMSGSVREILSFAAPARRAQDARMWEALRVACAEDFVRDWSAGLDTALGENGMGISEGQQQRIAIARAVFSGSPILLLDEATSALDMETEARVLKNLQSMTDRTVLIVTHRPAALDICNRRLMFTEQGCTEAAE